MTKVSEESRGRLLHALGSLTRRRVLYAVALSSGTLSVGELVTQLSLGQPKVSYHLAALRFAGLIEGERRGRTIYYRLHRPQCSLGEHLDGADRSAKLLVVTDSTFVTVIRLVIHP